jgi:hypothetical protein
MADGPRPELAELYIADPPQRWRELGFAIEDDRLPVGGVDVRLGGEGHGITGWTLRHLGSTGDLDGLPTAVTTTAPPPAVTHSNRVVGIDHVVITTGDFDRTAAVLAARGIPLRRVRQAGNHRQGFRRLGRIVMEIVEAPGLQGAPRFWGLVFVVADLEALREQLAPHVNEIRSAVQPGRQIATLAASAELGTQVAFMDLEKGA